MVLPTVGFDDEAVADDEGDLADTGDRHLRADGDPYSVQSKPDERLESPIHRMSYGQLAAFRTGAGGVHRVRASRNPDHPTVRRRVNR